MCWCFNHNKIKVLTTISDKRIPVENNGVVDYYVADYTSALDSAKCCFETYPYKVQNIHWLIPILKSLEFDKNELLRIHNRYYYPFGSPMDGRTFSSEKYRFGFNGKELDNEIQGDGNSLDFGGRIYDSRLGRWLSLDPSSSLFPFASPYNFVLNSTIQAIDPNGEVVIFIGGNHYSPINSSGNSSDYWREFDKNGNETYAFDKEVMRQFNDNRAIYRDGALGGWSPFNLGIFDNEDNMSATSRRNAGFDQATNDAPMLKYLKPGETINIVSHSMGGAYSKGYIEGLMTYMKENKIDAIIEIEVDFAPFQPDDNANSAFGSRNENEANKGSIPTFQFLHPDDKVAGDNQMNGAKKEDTSKDPKGSGLLFRHSIFSFKESVKTIGTLLNSTKSK